MADVDQEVLERETVDAAANAAATERLTAQFTEALDVSFWEGLTSTPQEIIAARTPEQIMGAFEAAMPTYKPALDEIRNDPALLTSLHNVLVKDPTMLEGMTGMFAETGSMDPEQFAQTLRDPQTRAGLTAAFDKIAEEEDFTFDDFKELYDARGDRTKSLAKLKELGVKPTDLMTGKDMLHIIGEYFNDPIGMGQKLPELLGLTGAQGEAFGKVMEMFGQYIELCIGGPDGYRSLFQKYGPSAVAGGTQFFQDISGETDRLAAQRAEAGTGEPVDPAQGSPPNTRAPFSAATDPAAAAASDRYNDQTRELTARRDTAPAMAPGQ